MRNHIADSLHVLQRQRVVNRQSQDALGNLSRFRQWIFQREAAVTGKISHQRIKIAAREDIVALEGGVKLIAIHAELIRIYLDRKISVIEFHVCGWQFRHMNPGNTFEPRTVERVNLLPAGKDAFHVAEDLQPHQRLKFVHFGIGAGHHNFRLPVEPEIFQVIEHWLLSGIREHQHAALNRVEKLGGVETEHAQVSVVADGFPVHSHAKRVGGIVEQREIVAAGDVRQLLEPARITIDVHREDGSGPGRDGFFHLLRIKRVMVRLDVNEDGTDFVPVKGVSCGHESKRRGDDFARQAEALERDLEGQRAVVEEAEVLGVKLAAQFLLKPLDNGAIIGEPGAVPNLLKSVAKIRKRREERSRHVNGFFKWNWHNTFLCCGGRIYIYRDD